LIRIVVVPAADVQPPFISVTDSPTLPLAPAVKTIAFVPCPDVNVPFVTVQLYVDPLWYATFAVSPVWFGFALDTAYTVGVAGVVHLIRIVVVPAADVQPPFISVTDSPTLPLAPAVKTIAFVPCPDVSVPFVTVQL
jgi:hypothetical protein